MKKYFFIHSSDPYLLARLCTDLQMEGWHWTGFNDPFIRDRIVIDIGIFYFIDHEGVDNPTRLTLTSRNYHTILKQIL